MLCTVRKTIEDNDMLCHGDGVVVGVSGGADSVALLYALKTLTDEYGLRLYVAHLDHMLRGDESDRDREYVCELSGKLGLTVECRRVDVEHIACASRISLEEAGRNARYQLFRDVAQRYGCSKVAVAHHRDDQVETVLLHLLRGSGLKGLGGMAPVRNDGEYTVIRPLIDVCKDEIEQYCKSIGVCPMVDHTNLESIYMRNKVRNLLIPMLKEEYNQQVVEAIARTSVFCRQADEYIEKVALKALNDLCRCEEANEKESADRLCMDLKGLSVLDEPVLERLMLLACFRLCGEVKGFYSPQISALCELVRKGRTGTSLDLPHGLAARVKYDVFVIERSCAEKGVQFEGDVYIELPLSGTIFLPDTGLEIDSVTYNYILSGEKVAVLKGRKDRFLSPLTLADLANRAFQQSAGVDKELKAEDIGRRWAAFDLDGVKGRICLRPWRAADRIGPFGMKGTKLLSDLFTDLKVPREERKRVYIASDDEEVLWALGFRTSRRAAVTEDTRQILFAAIKGPGN